MSKFTITVKKGVAAVYPDGTKGKPQELRAGDSIACITQPHDAHSLRGLASADVVAPAAGVAIDQPYGDREGVLQVEVQEGAVTVRIYAGADFTTESVAAGEKTIVPVTESNRITLAVYDASVQIQP
jgi:hypothetical protein